MVEVFEGVRQCQGGVTNQKNLLVNAHMNVNLHDVCNCRKERKYVGQHSLIWKDLGKMPEQEGQEEADTNAGNGVAVGFENNWLIGILENGIRSGHFLSRAHSPEKLELYASASGIRVGPCGLHQ
jgi:hypothetical protein